MKFSILTLFPEIIESFFTTSIMARSVASDTISYDVVNFRDYATDKHKTCDDAPYGGGAGMVLKPEPLGSALDAIQAKNKRVIYPTPSGKRFTQAYARELSKEDQLVIICGRYEGIDQRIIDLYVDDEICIGDYVISSGEVAALVIVDAVYRLVDGVISDESLEEESFTDDKRLSDSTIFYGNDQSFIHLDSLFLALFNGKMYFYCVTNVKVHSIFFHLFRFNCPDHIHNLRSPSHCIVSTLQEFVSNFHQEACPGATPACYGMFSPDAS